MRLTVFTKMVVEDPRGIKIYRLIAGDFEPQDMAVREKGLNWMNMT